MIFKKNIAICATLLNASVLLSQSAVEKNDDQKKRFSGIFLGFHTGYQHFLVKNSYDNMLDLKYFIPGSVGTEYLAAHGSLVGGHVVLSHVFDNNFYLGTEVGQTYNFAERTSTDEAKFDRSYTYKQNEDWAFFLRMGGINGSVLFYGKAGVSLMNRTITIRFSDLYEYINPIERSKKYIKGVSFGLGVAVPLDGNTSLGFEAEYIKYEADKNLSSSSQNYVMIANNLKFKLSFLIKI
ncbi:MAG: hypothetical protein CNLJKLNK_01213 [Holosporales bacterium]